MRTIINFALMIIVVTAFVAVVCASAYLLGWIYKRGRKVSHQPQKDDVRNRREKNLDSTILTMEIDMPPSYEEAKQQTKEKIVKLSPNYICNLYICCCKLRLLKVNHTKYIKKL